MYPREELMRLTARKVALQRNIALLRVQCEHAAARAVQPVAWLDRMLDVWRRLSPIAGLAAVPVGFVIKHTLFRRYKVLGSLVGWVPLVAGVIRGISSAAKARSRVTANARSTNAGGERLPKRGVHSRTDREFELVSRAEAADEINDQADQ